jgi:EF-P beta-lysylation protein EpmB
MTKTSMIPCSDLTWQSESSSNWQRQLQQAVTDPQELLQLLQLESSLLPEMLKAAQQFPLRVPRAFINRMQPGNIQDPLLRQVLPISDELNISENYSQDPVSEINTANPGLIQKYQGRALLVVNGHCAINCRYCFRRHFPYNDHKLNRQQWLNVIKDIAQDQSIEEVIFSGGDPLASSDKQLEWVTEQIAAITHIKRLRIHSRLPVVIPDRITKECLSWMNKFQRQTIFVFHINHPNEIDQWVAEAANKLRQSDILLLNQSVLLREVNDCADTLKVLSEKLFGIGILPYYLHLLDPVAGASHFDLPLSEAEGIYRQLMDKLSGFLVPKMVKEVPGEGSKILSSQLTTF